MTRVLDIDDCREWSQLVDDELQKPPLRKSVLAERNGLVRFGFVAVTSRDEAAQELRDPNPRTFWLNRDDLRWFAEQIPKALAYVEGKDDE